MEKQYTADTVVLDIMFHNSIATYYPVSDYERAMESRMANSSTRVRLVSRVLRSSIPGGIPKNVFAYRDNRVS